uniref:CCHC-type domain-containing protein n=1 Tax=Strongyloides papillosus TaxID=174720 RepID=A0A0N5BYS3_STREA
MDKLDKKNRGSNGTKPLSYFMNNDDQDPTAVAVDQFFGTNMEVIRLVYPNIHEREAIREELKSHFETLLCKPPGNSLLSCYKKWRAVSPNCQFGFLIGMVRKAYARQTSVKANLQLMKSWKQRGDETVHDYNLRYLRKMKEIYPDFENTLYKKATLPDGSLDYWRMEIAGVYMASLLPALRKKMPLLAPNDKCLEIAMITAEFCEEEYADRYRKANEVNERKGGAVFFNRVGNENEQLICHNCGNKGHAR